MTFDELCGIVRERIEYDSYSALNIYSHVVPLGGEALAFVYRSKGNNFHIFINESISTEAQREVFVHELYHIAFNMPYSGYILGVDKHRSPIEEAADVFAHKLTKAI
jgi:Zn-dependent peptidase ImmA (M78 family)